MRRLEEFRIFYNHTIHPELMRLDRHRKRLLWLLFFSLLFLTGIFIFDMVVGVWLITLLLSLPAGIYISYLAYQIQRFIRTFKPRVVNLILDFIDDSVNYGALSYDAKGGISKKTFIESMLFGAAPDVYQAEDYIKGSIGSITFELCELNVREESRVRSRLNYVFKGIFFHAVIEESLQGTIIIFPRGYRQYLSRAIREAVANGAKNIDMMMRHKEFRESFISYATKDARVRDLLSEDMQRILVNYRDETGKEIYISFIGKDIYLAVTEHKNILEPYLFRSNVSFELVREFYEDITMLFEIVEDFDKLH
ncbi:MAG: DUF3137 domain-containing protein [Saprospiraceae bacterium]